MFHEGDLQSGIALAVQTQKAVLCFVHDDTDSSNEWEQVLLDDHISLGIQSLTVALKLKVGSQEARFLDRIHSIRSLPAILVIRNAAVELDLQSQDTTVQSLKDRLAALFGSIPPSQPAPPSLPEAHEPLLTEPSNPTPNEESEVGSSQATDRQLGYLDLQPSSGRFRLPNNAYDALRSHTESRLGQSDSPEKILESQLALLGRLPIFRDEVGAIRSRGPSVSPILSASARDRLLRLPASAIKAQAKSATSAGSSSSNAAGRPIYTSPPSSSPPPDDSAQPQTLAAPRGPSEPPSYSTSQHVAQRQDYVREQKQREQSQRDERERIKAQIKADREERRRKEKVQKQNEAATVDAEGASASSKPKSREVRIQVRTFDGSTLRTTLPPNANITSDVRPWIDSSTDSKLPYNLKIILTPLPNRSIEASEEEHSLTDLGIRGSCTLVMVPVKSYVESYTGNTPTGLVGSAVSGGFNLVTGTAGALFGGVRSMLGYGAQQPASAQEVATESPQTSAPSNLRVRTLADQRLEERGRDHQFYNGNTLNFEPNRDDDESRKND